MLLSIANTTPRNIESVRSKDLFPSTIQTNAKNLIEFVEYYYEYLNSEGLPSNEISAISSLKDIDLVSAKYLDQIGELIANSIPQSKAVNRIELYKNIVRYYNTRGSEDSIHNFFKIFFDQLVEIVYPKDHLFKLSEGDWSVEDSEYRDHKSFASDDYKLFDGRYWQDYSYVIRSDIDSGIWYNDYLKFVHPAGLKMFSAVVIQLIALNKWNEPMNYESRDLSTDDLWMKALIPPHILKQKSIGFHTPKYQPGWLRERFFKYLFTYLIAENVDPTLVRLVLHTIKSMLTSTDTRSSYVRARYLVDEKFVDPCELGAGMLHRTIGDADESYSITNRSKFLNLSAFITKTPMWGLSSYESSDEDSDIWDISSYDTSGGDGSGSWNSSSYEEIIA